MAVGALNVVSLSVGIALMVIVVVVVVGIVTSFGRRCNVVAAVGINCTSVIGCCVGGCI